MNILFFHGDETCPTMGGIQRTTAIVAEGLKEKYGHVCYNIYNYDQPYPEEVPRYKYEVSERMPVNLNPSEVADFINKYKIDVIVNQMGVAEHKAFRIAVEKSGRNCRLLYFHHTTPQRLWDLSFSGALRKLRRSGSLKDSIKNLIIVSLFPIYKPLIRRRTLRSNASNYRTIYKEADNFVLLSRFFYDEWQELTGIKDLSKLRAIPNARSFEMVADRELIGKKEKRVLIVSRMVEFPKQILLALKIWRHITQDPQFSGWSFDIVGTGKDIELFKSYMRRHKIPRVTFHGRQESLPFFEKSSIFLMTSVREGWGMSLVEAMQMGCVPVAFDSFGSVREIIENGKTGFLVKPFDRNEFESKVKLLMKDNRLREEMAEMAAISTKRFSKDHVLQMWQQLITE